MLALWGSDLRVKYHAFYKEIGMQRHLTAVYEKREDWYVAYLEEIPGVNTQGKTMEEARMNLNDALALFLEANRELGIQGLS
jgi:predicted RNase H-like HicB family nuclease